MKRLLILPLVLGVGMVLAALIFVVWRVGHPTTAHEQMSDSIIQVHQASDSVRRLLPGRGVTAQSVGDEWEVYGVAIWKADDHTQRSIVPLAGALAATPIPATPVPSATHTPSLTPPPTNTPRATATNTLTPTDTPIPSPTQEPPIPTATGTPGPGKACELKNGATATRIRNAPSLTASITGSWAAAEMRTFTAFAVADGYLWGHHAGGWSVVAKVGTPYDWWVYGVEHSEVCQDVSGWPAGVQPPAAMVRIPALGFHAVPGANGGEMQVAFGGLRAAGFPFAVKAVNEDALCRMAVDAGGECIFRSVHPSDCPNVDAPDAALEARRYLQYLSPYVYGVLAFATRIEIVNECRYDPGDMAFWNGFNIEALRLAREWHWPPLVVMTHGPGSPQPAEIAALGPTFQAMRQYGACLGVHAYTPGEGVGLADSTIWLGYRHRLTHALMVTAGYGDIPLCITEAARDWGGSAVDEDDFARWYAAIRGDSYVEMVALWTAGSTSQWPLANLNGHMIEIARKAVG